MIDSTKLALRTADSADLAAIEELHRRAFGAEDEAKLVRGLHEHCDTLVSLVAVLNDKIVGHILFSPVTTETATTVKLFGLAPMGVMPELQSSGIGSRLVDRGLARCRDIGVDAVVVLGHKNYYPRFGFRPAAEFGLDCVYDVPREAFMALELEPGALRTVSGTVHYHPQFDQL